MRYVDGFVIPIRRKDLAAYRRIAARAGRIWREHGALEYLECAGDDLKQQGMVPFPRAARARAGETVVFAWIVYKSKAHRDRVNAKVMKDPRIERMAGASEKVVDAKRMVYGGFKAIVDL
jgi:uncharacterized protein YbaA (DUF1428 family)